MDEMNLEHGECILVEGQGRVDGKKGGGMC